MNFGEALRELKDGFKVARSGWNGKGMYLGLCRGMSVKEGFQTHDFIYLKTTDDQLVPWVPSQTDLLDEDWFAID